MRTEQFAAASHGELHMAVHELLPLEACAAELAAGGYRQINRAGAEDQARLRRWPFLCRGAGMGCR